MTGLNETIAPNVFINKIIEALVRRLKVQSYSVNQMVDPPTLDGQTPVVYRVAESQNSAVCSICLWSERDTFNDKDAAESERFVNIAELEKVSGLTFHGQDFDWAIYLEGRTN